MLNCFILRAMLTRAMNRRTEPMDRLVQRDWPDHERASRKNGCPQNRQQLQHWESDSGNGRSGIGIGIGRGLFLESVC